MMQMLVELHVQASGAEEGVLETAPGRQFLRLGRTQGLTYKQIVEIGGRLG